MIYVHEPMKVRRNKNWPYIEASHLYADTVEELHSFAKSLNLKRSWFQDKPDFPHYDITRNKYYQAIKLGASIKSVKHMVMKIKENRRLNNENDY